MDKEEKKALGKEFRKTKYGKRAFITYIICLVAFIITLIVYYVIDHELSEEQLESLRWFCIIIVSLTSYYEGAYAGALKQYILDKSGKK